MLVEGMLDCRPLARQHSAVQEERSKASGSHGAFELEQRVPILGKDDRRLARPTQEPKQEREFGLACGRAPGGHLDPSQQSAFFLAVRETWRAEHAITDLIVDRIVVQREKELRCGRLRPDGVKQRCASMRRDSKRPGAG